MTITILSRYPEPDTTVGQKTHVFVSAESLDGFDPTLLTLTVQSEAVYDGALGFVTMPGGTPDGSAGFMKPGWTGKVTITPTHIALRAEPRRLFNNRTRVTVEASFSLPRPLITTVVDTWNFYIVEPSRTHMTIRQLSPAQRRMNQPFPLSCLDQYRQVLGATLSPDGSLASQAAAIRLDQSISRPLLGVVKIATPAPLHPEELSRVGPTNQQLSAFTGLWETALQELRGLGVGPQTLETLKQAMKSDSPLNRVGAACGAVLLGAAFLDFQGR